MLRVFEFTSPHPVRYPRGLSHLRSLLCVAGDFRVVVARIYLVLRLFFFSQQEWWGFDLEAHVLTNCKRSVSGVTHALLDRQVHHQLHSCVFLEFCVFLNTLLRTPSGIHVV